MKRIISILCFFLMLSGYVLADEKKAVNPQVTMETSKGKIVLELYSAKAPITVENFVAYVNDGFYDNTFLNHKNNTPEGWGYAVFGKVIGGMEVVDAISAVKTGTKGPHGYVPIDNIVIKKVIVKY